LRLKANPALSESLNKRNRCLGGLFVRRERWGLSFRDKVLVALLVIANAYGLIHGLYPFLRVDDGRGGQVLVIEGWVFTPEIERAAEVFHSGHYQRVVVVRGVYPEGNKWETGQFTADWVATYLAERGVPQESIKVLLCPMVRKDRTYSCALAVRDWLRQSNFTIDSLDVVTLAAHTRRSRLLYAKAFGDDVKVGSVALDDLSYDPAHWWRSSEGIREVPFEALAYLYVRLLFHPEAEANR